MLSLVFNQLQVCPILFLFCLCAAPLLNLLHIILCTFCSCSCTHFICVLHIIIICLIVDTFELYCTCTATKWLPHVLTQNWYTCISDLDVVFCIPNLSAHRWARFKHSNNHLNNPLLVHPYHLWRPQPPQLLIAAHCPVPLQRPLGQVLVPLERRSLLRSRTKTQQR